MKKLVTVALATATFVLAGSALADEHESDEMTWFPVETYACNFRDGAGPDDLDGVVAEWNDWMDEKGQDTYFAVTLWPEYFGERAFDFGWLGAWQDGNEMGAGLHFWATEGDEIGGKFWEIIDCGARTQFAATELKSPGGEDEDGSFLLEFSNCSFDEDGGGMEAYLAAQQEWNAYADETGFAGGQWMMFPVYGENVEAEYDFKAVASAADYREFGANWQLYAEGHYQKSQELFGDILDCDSARVYMTKVVREMAGDE